MKFLITGGAGYIGSSVASALEDAGHTPIILDSLVTGRPEFTRNRIFYKADIANRDVLQKIFLDHPDIEATLHCAALIVVPESVEQPYLYYRENVAKSLELFMNLHQFGCDKVVFSSSASIYDLVPEFMVNENSPLNPNCPYARTKLMMEMVLKDFCIAYGMQGIALRYFNPIGADPKMRSGIHVKAPSHVLGKLVDTAQGKIPQFSITGTEYETRDGTGIRDYIHIWDLASAHVKALTNFDQVFNRAGNPAENYVVINLGTGKGVTVRELVSAFERVYGQTINKVDQPPRPGDVAGAYANADTALRLLDWKAEHSIDDGIRDALKWGQLRENILKWD
jgi:UDP-glucose 4-epimerase